MKYPTNEQFQNRPQTAIPRGFMVFSWILIAMIVVIGTITFFNLKGSLELPDELKEYAYQPSTLALLTSHNPAPADTAQLTPERITLFMGTLAPVASGYNYMRHKLDSLTRREGDDEKFDFWGSPYFIQQMNRMPMAARRDLVTYLNKHNLSWDEYIWLKEHTVAAAGITQHDFDSLFDVRLRPYFREEDSANTNAIPAIATPLYTHAALLRPSLDSATIARVAPYRQQLLDSGFASLMGIETRFAEEQPE